MLVLLKPGTPETTAIDIMTRLRMAGLAVHRTDHDGRVRIAGIGDLSAVDWEAAKLWPGVESTAKLAKPFKLASRAFRPPSRPPLAPPAPTCNWSAVTPLMPSSR